MTAALSGGAFTAACLCWMGVGSGELPADNSNRYLLSSADVVPTGALYFRRDLSSVSQIVRGYDGVNIVGVNGVEFIRGEIHLRVVQTNVAKTQYRVGYRRYTSAMVAIDANIVWGDWVAYDGSMNPLTHLRFGYNLTVPIGFLQTQLWAKSASDAEILRVLEYAL